MIAFMTKTAVRDYSHTVLNADCKLIDFLGLCELQNARARYQAQKCLEEDEIIKESKSDKYGDHIHLTMCIKTGTQPRRQGFILADLIAQTEFRQAINPDEYMKTSKGKPLNLGVDTFRDMESSSVQQSPVISRLRDVMLPNYLADPDDLVKSTRTQTSSEREAPERTSHDSGSVMGHGPEEKSLVPKRQSNKCNAITRSDLSKRTEEEWEYMSSCEERYVTLVPLLDACKACKKDKGRKKAKSGKRRNTTSLRVTEATIGPESDAGANEIAEQTSEDAPSGQIPEASRAPEPDDAVFLEFTEQTRENSPCTPILEVSNAPESDTQVFDQMSDANLGVPEPRDTQILQHDEAVYEQMSEDNLGALDTKDSQPLQYDEVSLEQMEKAATAVQVIERSDDSDSDVQIFDQMSEDILGELETRDTHILQYDGASSERMGEKTPDVQLRGGSDALELDTNSVDEVIGDALGEPEKRDRHTLQHDGAFPEQVGENTVDMQVMEGSDAPEFETRLLTQLSEYIKDNPETGNTQHSHNHGILFEQIGASTPEMQAIEGANAVEPHTHVHEQSIENARFTQATQRTVATQQYWEFLDQISETPLHIQVPEETSALEPYVDILRQCPFSGRIELKTMNGIFATPEPMAQTNRQAKQSPPNLQSRQGTNAIQHNRKWPEQAIPRIQVPKGTDAPEPYVDILRRCPFSEKIELRPMNEIFATREPMAKAIRQASFVDRIDLLNLPPGIYPREPSTETKVARQTPLPPQGFADRFNSLQFPDGAYLQNCSTEVPKPAQLPIRCPSAPTLTPAYPTGSDQQQPTLVTASQKREEPPNQEFISWSSPEARRVINPLEIESEGESRLDHTPTHDFMPSNPTANLGQQNSQEIHGEGGPQFIEFPTQAFWPSISTGVPQQPWSSKIRRERDSEVAVPPPQDSRHLNFTGSHQQQHSAELGIEDDFALEQLLTKDFRPLNLTGAHQQQRSAGLGLEGDFALEGPPTQDIGLPDFEAPLPYRRPSELETEGNLALEGPPTKDFRSWNLTGAHQQERPLELGMEGNFALEGLALEGPPRQALKPSDFAGARQYQHSSDRAMEGDARSNGGRSKNFGPEGLTGARQPQLSASWNMCPPWADPYSQNMTLFHPAETRQQQRSAEAGRESNLQSEHPPPQEFRPLYAPRISRQHPWLDIGGGSNLQWDTPLSQESRIPQSTGVRRQQPFAWTNGEGEPRSRVAPRRDFRPAQPTGGYQRSLSSEIRAYGRDLPLGPPVQAFPPPKSWKDPRQEGNTRDTGAPVQPQPQQKAPPLFSYPWFKLRNGSRQGENSGDMGRQIQTPLTGRPTESIPAPLRQQGQHQAEWRPDTGGRLVSSSTKTSVPSFSWRRPQREADVGGPLRETGKQGKAPPPVSQPRSHRHEPGSMSRNNKSSWK